MSEAERKRKEKWFGPFVETWLRSYSKTNHKPSTWRSYATIAKMHFIPYFGRKRLAAIDVMSIESYKAQKQKEGLSPKTINNHLSVLRKCLTTAEEWGIIATVPRVNWLSVPPQKFDFLTSQESRQLLAAIEESPFYSMILCALRTGIRFGELIALKWQDIDLRRGQITVRRSVVRGIEASPKNNRIRYIPMSPDLQKHFRKIARAREYVFGMPGGKPRTRGSAWRGLQTACKSAGLRPIGWHVLRHTFASQLVMEGASPRAVQELLGHADLKMTMRYAHLSPSSLRDVVSLLPAAEERESEKSGHYLGPKQEITARSTHEAEIVLE